MHLRTLHELDRTEGTVQLREPANNDGTPSKLVLIPHPNPNDPNDPLRWPRWKKHTAFTCVCLFAAFTNFGIGGMAPAFYPLSLEFGTSMTKTSEVLEYPILVMGLFNFFWVPLANRFGKRPVFVFASGLLFATTMWGAEAGSFKSLLWSNIIGGFAGSATEALGAAIVNDIYFLHERSTKMSIYIIAIAGGNCVGPLVCGFVTQSLGWRWHKWLTAILTGLNFLAVVFFVPETRYARDFSASLGVETSSSTVVRTASNSSPYGSGSDTEAEKGEYLFSSSEKRVVNSASQSDDEASSPATSSPPRAVFPDNAGPIPPKSYLQQLALFTRSPPDTPSLLSLFIRPFPLLLYPSIIFAFLAYAVSLAWVVVVNTLSSFTLEAPPYSYSIAATGLINIPGILGTLFGAFIGGPCTDWYSDYNARRNKGVFRPESRLVLLIVPVLLVPAGCIMFGFGVAETLSWPALYIGYGFISVGLASAPSITMTYVSDCCLPVAADALLLVNGLKNIVCFGMLYAVVPWVARSGYKDCFGAQAGIYVGVVGIGGALLWWRGQKVRRIVAGWRVIL